MGIKVPPELLSSTPEAGLSPADSVSEDAAVLERTEQRLAKAFGDAADDTAVDSDLDEVEDAEEETDSPEDSETPAVKEGEESEDSDEDVAEPEADGDDSSDEDEPEPSTLPAAWRRSAKARGWSDEEIDRFWKADTELASKTFEPMHASRVAETNEWASLGRAARDQQQSQQAPPVEPKPAAPAVPSAGSLSLVDVEKLTEQYGNEELVNLIAGPVNEVIRRMNETLPIINQGVEAVQQAQRATLSRQLDAFFGGEDMKSYVDAYGESFDSLTQEQQDRRFKVVEMADALMYGAAQQHRKLPIDEALTLAHEASSSDLQEKAIRTKIKKSVTKRSRGRTLKPSQRGKQATDKDDSPKNREELVATTQQRLDKMNW